MSREFKHDTMPAVFSERTRWDLTANRLSRALADARRSGKRILDLTASNPTRVGLVAPADVLQALADPEALVYDPSPQGLEAARDAVAVDYARRGINVPAERIVLTASSSEAYAFLFKLLADPGDNVLVPAPSYPLFDYLAGLESVETRSYPLAYDGSWHIDFPALAQAFTPRTRAILVVHPNNPTGSFVKAEEARRLARLGADRGAAIVSDEVFADYAFRPDHTRAESFAGPQQGLAFSIGGLSKACGLPQLKLGWIAATGPERLVREALDRLEVVADTYLSVGTPVQRAAPRILGRLPELQRPIAERVRRNRTELASRVAASPATLLEAEGGWYAVLHVPATVGEEERTLHLLEGRGVLVHPGFFFGFPREAYLIVSLIVEPAVFDEGTEALVGDLLE